MKHVEGNKLIAEFMGEQIHKNDEGVFYTNHKTDDEYQDTLTLELWAKYHSSWDWLVPVVKKTKEILLTEKNWHGLPPDFYMQFCEINDVWGAVVNFIEWYNKQQSAT